MFYLHLLDGSKNHRGSIIAITETESTPTVRQSVGNIALVGRDGKPELFDAGWTLGPVPTEGSAKKLAYAIAREYNYDVMIDGKTMNLPYAPAVELGRKGGKVTSEAKAAAARRNGRKGGRPRKKPQDD